jgi:hypothetical protein
LNGHYLLCNHTKHFWVNAVEFVKAAPRPRRSQTFEKFLHCKIIKPIGSVEHNAMHAAGLCKVFNGFRLASTSGAF